MFKIYQSHSLQKLAQQFSKIYEPNAQNPLRPSWVIVQNNEIKEWLSLNFASNHEIAGNFRFIFPSEFQWFLYRLKKSDIPGVLPSDLNAMQWSLFELYLDNPKLLTQTPLKNTSANEPERILQFSSQLADIFDQYQVYRPQMMQAWLDGKLVTKHKDEKWQASIWKRLNESWKSGPGTKYIPSRAEAFNELLDWLEDDATFLDQLPQQLYVFGLSQTSSSFLKIISRLAKHTDVHFFTGNEGLTPEIKSEGFKELVSDWMKPASEQKHLLQKILQEEEILYEFIAVEPVAEAALPELSVHSCYNKRREVQVLKDELLYYLDQHPGCDLSQVLIMVPDANEYASLLESIFENDEGEPSLPVSRLSNHLRQSEEYTLNALLNLLLSSYKTSEVLQVLSLEPIQQKFLFSNDELDVLEEWILDNKIFRGLGYQYNSAYSWQKAINQMVSGFAMDPPPLAVFNGLVPYTEIVSREDMLLAARLSAFIHALVRAEATVRQHRTPLEWLNYTSQITRDFMGYPHQETSFRIYKTISKLKEQAAYTESKKQLSYQTIKNWLKAQFDTASSASGRFGQGITVSSYVPYRSVPFQFIGVLGMNEGVFPRRAVRTEFDLIYANPKPGDRIQKEDDTYLFLETIFAAAGHLHISYKGQDQRTNSKRLPSILVQQYLDTVFEDWEKGIEYHHLHPFNINYFKKHKKKFSYSQLNLNLAKKIRENGAERPKVFVGESFNKPEPFENERIHISDIISFFTHPSKYLLYNKLGVNNYSDFNQISDREPFKLNNLERYYLDDFLFQNFSKGEPEQKVFEFAQAAALIPDKLEGEKSFIHEKEKVLDLMEVVNELAPGEGREVEIEIQLGSIELYGTISGVYDNALVSYRVGKRRPNHELQHWLKHLLLLENGTGINKSFYISKESEEIQKLEIESDNISENQLSKLLVWYKSEKSILNKTAFFPKTSRAYAERLKKKGDPEDALTVAYKTWLFHKRYNQFAESNDYFHALMWRNLDPLANEDFEKNAQAFWDPFLEAVKEEEA